MAPKNKVGGKAKAKVMGVKVTMSSLKKQAATSFPADRVSETDPAPESLKPITKKTIAATKVSEAAKAC